MDISNTRKEILDIRKSTTGAHIQRTPFFSFRAVIKYKNFHCCTFFGQFDGWIERVGIGVIL